MTRKRRARSAEEAAETETETEVHAKGDTEAGTLDDMWQRVKTGGKAGFDKAYAALDKLGPPINNLSNKLGSEAFWPTTLDQESDKAARILKSFCSKAGEWWYTIEC